MEDPTPLSFSAEAFLRSLEDEFACEDANQTLSGRADLCQYASATDARLAMLRQAYLKGRYDALTPPADLDTDRAMVATINALQDKREQRRKSGKR